MSRTLRMETAKTCGDRWGRRSGREAEESDGVACTGPELLRRRVLQPEDFGTSYPYVSSAPVSAAFDRGSALPATGTFAVVVAARSPSVLPPGAGRTPKANTSGRA